ncbi:C2H2 type zinc finger domain protein [Penicillium mononematosum]|uniref:C2H2 type zinc finger domain protein n=1 Tax=Penicillium mononematosum TaxID=268346 RepID=UPI002547ED3E|nr:C2H2 type zinc finger domain protein [Penicillium mononematosum]KAJ6178050.1 C2H2 type zinc finger domain protein [Penicillium mononematosum]
MPKIRLLVQQMLEQIRSLYELSALLRRPKISDKYIRSVNSNSKGATLNDQDSLPLDVSFSHYDEGHIVEKVLQWRGLAKSGRCVEFEDEDVAPMGQTLTDDGVEDILWFCQRLSGANTRRREQLQYWTDHPYDPKQDTSNVAPLETQFQVPVPVHGKQVEEKEPLSQPAILNPPNLDVSRKGPKSVMSKQSFSTAAVSDIHDTKTNVRPRTVYAPTAIGQGRSNSVPHPPKAEDGKLTFPCPYCGMTLESSEMQNRATWKRHVFRDLRPYVCTFEDCANAGKLYVSRHDWIYHELQIHRRKYVCKECDKRCPSRKEMSTHLREHFGESISPAQLVLILDLCDHQIDVSGANEKDTCLVCGEELQLSTLQGHLAAHMEDIALFILPSAYEEEETGGSRASVQVAKLESKGTSSGTDSEASSLAFSTAGDYGQTPADFSKLLTSEEAGYTSKFSSWRTTDEDQELESIKAMVTRLEDPDRDVRHAAVQALSDQTTLPDEIFNTRLDYLNSLIHLLGEKQDYKKLVLLLGGLWDRRNQMINWSPAKTLQLGRRYVLARYLVGEIHKAVRLAEDILYKCSIVNGVLHWSNLEISTLVSQLYTGVGTHYQSAKNGQPLASRYYKKSAALHERLLFLFANPSWAEEENDFNSGKSTDDLDIDLDLTDTTNGASVSDGEHVRQHLFLLKLALQRLGDWPKDYSEYERLNADLFLRFGNELKDFEGVDKWNLKEFGGGKASSNEDMLELGFKSWVFDFSMVGKDVKEELYRVPVRNV